jgi:hypothetical protein
MNTHSCPTCDDYGVCSGIPCPDHPLIEGLIKELNDAIDNGLCWGDMMLQEEAAALAKESNPAKEMRLKKMGAEERKRLDGLKTYIVGKCKMRSCEVVNGKHVLKQKLSKRCENVAEPDVALPDGSIYAGGCWAHKEGVCPFMHPGEEKIYTFTDHRPIRLVNGKMATVNATYYSPKALLPQVASQPKKIYMDAW